MRDFARPAENASSCSVALDWACLKKSNTWSEVDDSLCRLRNDGLSHRLRGSEERQGDDDDFDDEALTGLCRFWNACVLAQNAVSNNAAVLPRRLGAPGVAIALMVLCYLGGRGSRDGVLADAWGARWGVRFLMHASILRLCDSALTPAGRGLSILNAVGFGW